MTLTMGQITFDTADAVKLAQWWAGLVGGTISDPYDGWFVMLADTAVGGSLAFQKVEDPTPGKNRLHLDFGSSDGAGDVARALAAGATLVAEHTVPDGSFGWTVLADPDGNQFCIAGG